MFLALIVFIVLESLAMTPIERIREQTRSNHDSVDTLVMSVQPFANKDNYAKFLQAQAVFHKILEPVYADANLNTQVSGLAALARYEAVQADLAILASTEVVMPDALPSPAFPRALGWLYCAEGSNLGAAILFKEAQKIGIDADSGASHLVGHADGRAPHWRQFCAQLNALPLDEGQIEEAVTGAKEAFAYYKQVIRAVFRSEIEAILA